MQPTRQGDAKSSSTPASGASDTKPKQTEPVAVAPGAREQEVYAARGTPAVTTADLARSFASADEQIATEAPFPIMRVDYDGE